jgi:dienelactone hydrolase
VSGTPSSSPAPQPSQNPRPGAPGRSSVQIRADIEAQQRQLATSVDALRSRVTELTDWRKQVSDHREQIVKGAVVAGFVVGGLLALRTLRRR